MESAEAAGTVQAAVTRNSGADTRNLIFNPWFVFDAPRNVCPGPVSLAFRNIVASPGTDHKTSLTGIRLGTVTRETWACDWSRATLLSTARCSNSKICYKEGEKKVDQRHD